MVKKRLATRGLRLPEISSSEAAALYAARKPRGGRSRRWTAVPARMAGETGALSAPASKARILGLDPGSIITGYAVLECSGQSTAYLASGGIRAGGNVFTERLQDIFRSVAQLVNEYRPDEIAIERVFMHRNPDSALKLGQARGAALCATFAVQARVYEYAPRQVKLAVVGTGAAQKEQVQLMVRKLLSLDGRIEGKMSSDAADALAIALCHANSRRLDGLLAREHGR